MIAHETADGAHGDRQNRQAARAMRSNSEIVMTASVIGHSPSVRAIAVPPRPRQRRHAARPAGRRRSASSVARMHDLAASDSLQPGPPQADWPARDVRVEPGATAVVAAAVARPGRRRTTGELGERPAWRARSIRPSTLAASAGWRRVAGAQGDAPATCDVPRSPESRVGRFEQQAATAVARPTGAENETAPSNAAAAAPRRRAATENRNTAVPDQHDDRPGRQTRRTGH